jgi:hypothetical protein
MPRETVRILSPSSERKWWLKGKSPEKSGNYEANSADVLGVVHLRNRLRLTERRWISNLLFDLLFPTIAKQVLSQGYLSMGQYLPILNLRQIGTPQESPFRRDLKLSGLCPQTIKCRTGLTRMLSF